MNVPRKIGHICVLATMMLAASTRAPATPTAAETPPNPPHPDAEHIAGETVITETRRVNPVPARTSRHLGMASLGLMAGALGVLWTRRRRSVHCRRRRYLREARFALLRLPASPDHSTPRHRVRRFDYDRFYLHMTRDL